MKIEALPDKTIGTNKESEKINSNKQVTETKSSLQQKIEHFEIKILGVKIVIKNVHGKYTFAFITTITVLILAVVVLLIANFSK